MRCLPCGLVKLHVTPGSGTDMTVCTSTVADGTPVGWADVTTADITVLRAEYRGDVIAVLTRHLQNLIEPVPPDRAPAAQVRPMLPPLTPADDLAVNPPGQSCVICSSNLARG